jgi:hypothetical protein
MAYLAIRRLQVQEGQLQFYKAYLYSLFLAGMV